MLNKKLLMLSYIRGHIIKNNIPFDEEILNKDIKQLALDDISSLIEYGIKNNLKLHYFKEKEDLARVKIVLGALKSLYPQTLLDVGSGRGVFLFPLLCEFPYLEVESVEILKHRLEVLDSISVGGISNLKVKNIDITTYDNEENKFDCITMLEVLEHIPNYEKAIENAIRLTRNFIIITVPSKEDDNPEHLHLLTKDKLTKVFNLYGVTNLKFRGVNNHLVLIAKK